MPIRENCLALLGVFKNKMEKFQPPTAVLEKFAENRPGYSVYLNEEGLITLEKDETQIIYCGRCCEYNSKHKSVVIRHQHSCKGKLLLDWSPFSTLTCRLPKALVVVAAGAFIDQFKDAAIYACLQEVEECVLSLTAYTTEADGVFFHAAYRKPGGEMVVRFIESGVYCGAFQALRARLAILYNVKSIHLLPCRVYTASDLAAEVVCLLNNAQQKHDR